MGAALKRKKKKKKSKLKCATEAWIRFLKKRLGFCMLGRGSVSPKMCYVRLCLQW